MNNMHYIGLDVHKKTIAFCIKLVDGQIVEQGTVSTNKKELATWANTLPPSCIIALEMFKPSQKRLLLLLQKNRQAISYCGLCSAEKNLQVKALEGLFPRKETNICST